MEARLLNGGTLAFVGDAVMTLQIRDHLVSKGVTNLKELQEKTSAVVSAKSQAAFAFVIEPELTLEELAIFKRGRNHKSTSTAKNQHLIDYRHATGLEALWGYWYLNNEKDRLEEMRKKLIAFSDNNE